MPSLLSAIFEHWQAITGGASLLGLVPIAPRLYRKLAQVSDCQWHREQCEQRESALTREVTYLRIAIQENLDARYGTDSSADDQNGTPTTPNRTHSSKRFASSGE